MSSDEVVQAPPTQHADPTKPPDWLLDSAKTDPARIGWLVSGYLAGVQAAQQAGACGVAHPAADARCGLHHGHVGAHSTVAPLIWPAALTTPDQETP